MIVDGIVLGDHTVLIALGIDSEGKKRVLGLILVLNPSRAQYEQRLALGAV